MKDLAFILFEINRDFEYIKKAARISPLEIFELTEKLAV